MKYVIIIPDGCADEAQEVLHGQTPLQAARTPHMDQIARDGVVGRSNNVPPSLTPASDVATLSLFGYDPLEVYTGRAPLETVAMGIQLEPHDWAIRCNLVYLHDGKMSSFTAHHIPSKEGGPLIESLQARLGGPIQIDEPLNVRGSLEFHPGVSYRNILVYRGSADSPAPFDEDTHTQPPHDIPDQPVVEHLPSGAGGWLLQELMLKSRDVFATHPINETRRAAGQVPVTQVWLWGQGKAPLLQPFADCYQRQGAIISAVDLVRGVGMLIGWKRIDVPGATGYLDTDYAAKGRYAVAALADHDLVCVHIEAPDEASHEGKAEAKVAALEAIDEHIVGPVHAALRDQGEYRILVSPDHRTTLRTRAHAHGMVPFAVAGTGVSSHGQPSYDEVVANTSPLAFEQGHRLMPWFLGESR